MIGSMAIPSGVARSRYPAPMPAWLTRNLVIVSLTSLLTDVSTEMVYPILPLFLVGVLSAPKGAVGLIEGSAECVTSVLRVFAGAWSDRLARRLPITIAGYSCSALGRVILAAANAWPLVLVARLVDRLGKGVRGAPRDALIADTVSKEARGRAFGLHRAADNFGAVLGVLVAYAAIRGGHELREVVRWSVAPAFLGVAVMFLAREPHARSPARTPPRLREAWDAMPPRLKAYLGLASLFALGNSSNQFLLLRAKDFAFDNAGVVLLYLVYNIAATATSYPAGAISDRVGRGRVLLAAYAAHTVVYAGFAALGPAGVAGGAALWAGFALYGLHVGLLDAAEKAFLSDLSPPEHRAGVLGLHAMLQGLMLLPASILAGLLWDHLGPGAAFSLGAAGGLAGAVGMLWLRTTDAGRRAFLNGPHDR